MGESEHENTCLASQELSGHLQDIVDICSSGIMNPKISNQEGISGAAKS